MLRSWKMKRPKVLDSFAVLALLNREEGFKKVESILRSADGERVIICAIRHKPASIITGDPEFSDVKDIEDVDIEWI